MEDSGNWLYIILAVIAGISGIISSVRKKREQAEAAARPVPVEVEEEDDWLQTFDTPVLQQTAPKKKKVAEKKAVKKFQPLSFKEEPAELNTDALDESQLTITSDTFRDVEEVKKAIIYSEILNRKY